MQQAYEKGLLNETDLKNIADFYNDGIKINTESLDASIEENIKKAKATLLRNDAVHPISIAKAEDFQILNYYGSYNGLFVVMLNNPYSEHTLEIVDTWEIIGGVSFHHKGHNDIEVVRL